MTTATSSLKGCASPDPRIGHVLATGAILMRKVLTPHAIVVAQVLPSRRDAG